ncbi:MAG: Holliday junction branch migration protein RuvA [Clostridia bacterium]|nr:Holliday junction branch migration protein RuvA [Clostridia bacterium]
MIGYIKGKILQSSNGTLLIENNGIGYEVACSSAVIKKYGSTGQAEVYTYLAVREDGISLYGFVSTEEKEMFLKLITVSGVGPKMGITILSNMELGELALKIATSNVKGLATIKGLGRKTAEKIIVELREKFSAIDTETGEVSVVTKKQQKDSTEEENKDAIIALMSLGLTRAECINGIKLAKEKGMTELSEIIKFALKNIK